jgi:hypothetical protein
MTATAPRERWRSRSGPTWTGYGRRVRAASPRPADALGGRWSPAALPPWPPARPAARRAGAGRPTAAALAGSQGRRAHGRDAACGSAASSGTTGRTFRRLGMGGPQPPFRGLVLEAALGLGELGAPLRRGRGFRPRRPGEGTLLRRHGDAPLAPSRAFVAREEKERALTRDVCCRSYGLAAAGRPSSRRAALRARDVRRSRSRLASARRSAARPAAVVADSRAGRPRREGAGVFAWDWLIEPSSDQVVVVRRVRRA